MSRNLLKLMCLGFLFAGSACGHGAVQIAASDSLSPGDFKLAYLDKKVRGSSGYSEQLTLHGRLESGGSVYLRLFITNMAGANGRAELTSRITMADGQVHRISMKKKRDSWRHGPEEFDLTIGPNRIQISQGEASVTLVGRDFEAQFTISSDVPSFRPSGESVQFGDGYHYQTTVLFPRGELEGTVDLKATDTEQADDSDPIELNGTVFAEHRFGNIALYDMSQRWLQVRDIGTEHTFVLSAFQRSERLGGGIQAWMFVADEDGIQVYEPSISLDLKDFVRIGKGPYDVPKSLSFQGKNGSVGVVKSDQLKRHKSDLSSLSPLVRRLVSLVMNPWTYQHDTRYLIRPTPDEDRTFTGQADYSYMQLK